MLFVQNTTTLSVSKIPSLIHNSNTFILFSTTLLTILGEFPEYSGHSGPYIALSHTLKCQSQIIGLIDAVYSILLNN